MFIREKCFLYEWNDLRLEKLKIIIYKKIKE